MGKHLILGDATQGNWRLPTDCDANALTERLKNAMETGTVERVAVEMNDNASNRAELLVNGALLVSAAVVELEEFNPTES